MNILRVTFLTKKVAAAPIDMASQRFVSLEGLRAYMAWWIVVMHLLGFTGSEHLLPEFISNFIMNGGIRVSVFMIISGFVIAHLLITRPEPYPVYLRRRAYRIFPIYLLCIAIAIPLASAQLALHSTPWVMQAARWQTGFDEQFDNFWTHLTLHTVLLHGVLPDTILPFGSWTILGPAWSLSLEWQFYLLAPLILLCIRKSIFSCIITVFLFVGIVALLKTGVAGTWQFPSMVFLVMPFFLIGIFSRILFAKICSFPVWWTIGLGIALAYVLRDIRIILCIWTFFMVAMRFESIENGGIFVRAIQGVATNRLVRAMGKVSFSTYLIHILVMAFVFQILVSILGESTQNIARVAALTTILMLPGISMLLYNFVEKPFVRLGAKREKARNQDGNSGRISSKIG